MAGVGGFFLKGLAGGLQWGTEMAWKKKQQKKLEEQQNKMIEAGTIFNAQLAEAVEDGKITDEEKNKISVTYFAGGYEFQEHYKNAMTHVNNMHKAPLEKEQKWMDDFIEMTSGYSPGDIPEMYDWGRKHFTSQNSRNFFEAYEKTQERKAEAMQAKTKAEVFESPSAVMEAYPDSGYKYDANAGGYIPTFQKPTEEPSQIESYPTLDKFYEKYGPGTPFDYNSKTGFSPKYVKPETGTGVAEKPRATSLSTLEDYRDKALNADTWEDAEKIINDYTEAGYDEKQLGITKETWINSQKDYLNNLLNVIKATVNEKGWLKTGEITPQEVSNQIDKNAPAPEVYEMFREEYMKYRDMLEKAGIDVSQFPKLKPLSEIEKVGFIEGLKTFGGVGRGQYKSIYY